MAAEVMAAEVMAAEVMAAVTLRMFMAGTLEYMSEFMAGTSGPTSEYMWEYMRGSAYAAELAWVAATTAAFGTAPDDAGMVVAGGLTG